MNVWLPMSDPNLYILSDKSNSVISQPLEHAHWVQHPSESQWALPVNNSRHFLSLPKGQPPVKGQRHLTHMFL